MCWEAHSSFAESLEDRSQNQGSSEVLVASCYRFTKTISERTSVVCSFGHLQRTLSSLRQGISDESNFT